jgi:hypothetical protein
MPPNTSVTSLGSGALGRKWSAQSRAANAVNANMITVLALYLPPLQVFVTPPNGSAAGAS